MPISWNFERHCIAEKSLKFLILGLIFMKFEEKCSKFDENEAISAENDAKMLDFS